MKMCRRASASGGAVASPLPREAQPLAQPGGIISAGSLHNVRNSNPTQATVAGWPKHDDTTVVRLKAGNLRTSRATQPQVRYLKDAPLLLNQVASPPGACAMLIHTRRKDRRRTVDKTPNEAHVDGGVASVSKSSTRRQRRERYFTQSLHTTGTAKGLHYSKASIQERLDIDEGLRIWQRGIASGKWLLGADSVAISIPCKSFRTQTRRLHKLQSGAEHRLALGM
jgi:hypothetical protein